MSHHSGTAPSRAPHAPSKDEPRRLRKADRPEPHNEPTTPNEVVGDAGEDLTRARPETKGGATRVNQTRAGLDQAQERS